MRKPSDNRSIIDIVSKEFFQAVLFDMDGLTINSEPQWLEAERELTAKYGYQWTIEDQAFCLGGPLSKVGQYMSDLVNGVQSGESFHRDLVDLMTTKVRQRAEFMPGAKKLLKDLVLIGTPVAMVSASPRSIMDAALTHIEPNPFHVTISADDVIQTKPDPEGYLKAANELSVDIKNCLILEDSLTGVTAARASGAKVIAVPHLVKIQTDFQTRVVNSLTDIDLDLLHEFYSEWF